MSRPMEGRPPATGRGVGTGAGSTAAACSQGDSTVRSPLARRATAFLVSAFLAVPLAPPTLAAPPGHARLPNSPARLAPVLGREAPDVIAGRYIVVLHKGA